MREPNIHTLEGLLVGIVNTQVEINGKWVPCRPEGFYGIRNCLRAAWLVFTGRADAVIWPEGQ